MTRRIAPPTPPPDLWAIVPVKPLAQAKSRLADVLTPTERARLVISMLDQMLATLRQVLALTEILVISADSRVGEVVRAHHLRFLPEPEAPGLNASLRRAIRAAQEDGARSVLILPADLPRICAGSIARLVHDTAPPPAVTLVPDRHGSGTNGLLLTPPDVIPPAFGKNSFARHRAEAHVAHARLIVHPCTELGADLDRPDDLTLIDAQQGIRNKSTGEVARGASERS